MGDQYHEVYIRTRIEECERRDPKGHYKRARSGQLPGFTGISAPFEEPENPDVVIDTESLTVEQAVKKLVDYVMEIPATE